MDTKGSALALWLGLLASFPAGAIGPVGSNPAPACGNQMLALMGEKMQELKVSAVQFPIRGNRTFDQFMTDVETYVRNAKTGDSDVVVFPELAILDTLSTRGGVSETQQLQTMARDVTPRFFDRIAELSREHDITILAGSAPRESNGGIVNTAFLAFPDGRRIMQDKIFLTPDEKAWNWRPGEELKVFDTPWGKSTILICYDCQFASLSKELSAHAPEVIFVPSMTGDKGFNRVRWAGQARAVEHHGYVVVTGTVDTRGEHVGQAALLTPQDSGFPGTIAEGTKNQPGMTSGTFNLRQLRQSRSRAGLYSAKDQVERQAPIRVVEDPTPSP